MWTKKWKSLPVIALAALTLLPACGKKSFAPLDKTTGGQAGQYLVIKPKLDLVIFQDNSDSMANAMAQVKPHLNNILSNLDTNWEYRVVVLPLLSSQNLNVKTVLATDCAGIPSASCTTSVAAFNSLGGDSGWINSRNSSVGNEDKGFQYMYSNLSNLDGSGFLRNDAALAIAVISNNDDHSGVTYNYRSDGSKIGINYTSATSVNSFNTYKNNFVALAASMNISRFYSIVAANNYSDCYGGGRTWTGKRYMDMASAMGGLSYDVCNPAAFTNVVNDLRSNLQPVISAFEFNYVVLDEEPDPATIKFKKNGVDMPNSAMNGWTYAGYLVNQPTSFAPMVGYARTGFMLRLDGSATLKGTDTYSVTYVKK